jgi:serine protease
MSQDSARAACRRLALAAALGLCATAPATAAAALPAGAERLAPGKVVSSETVLVRYAGSGGSALEVVEVEPGAGVSETLAELRAKRDVRWAQPDPIATISGRVPNDPGRSGKPRGWRADQWNFLTPPPADVRCTEARPCGVDAPRAWKLLRRAGHPEGRDDDGSRGAIVAVVDTGVAYAARGRQRRSPDLAAGTFVRGRDFVGNDDLALDLNGHGTHVTSTIAERTGNGRFVTGLGDGLRIMPVRVLSRAGTGKASDVAKGIRFATRKGADVINLSLEFNPGFDTCQSLRVVCKALDKARRQGVFVVGAAGNASLAHAQMPARRAYAVASSTIRGCLSRFSSRGVDVDLTAPGGGLDAFGMGDQCRPDQGGPGIVQLTLRGSGPILARGRSGRFGYPRYEGTSMAAPHVSATAALVISSGVLGRRPSPGELERWLGCSARPVFDETKAGSYGDGLLDTAAALDPGTPCPGLG